MPKQVHYIRDFSGGINSQRNPRDIADNQSPFSQDAMGDRMGLLRTMGNGSGAPRQINNSGATKTVAALGTTDMANARGHGFKHFELDYDEAGNEEEGGEHYFAVVDEGGELNIWDYTNNSWNATPTTAGGAVDLGGQSDIKANIIAFDNGLRICDSILENGSTPKYFKYIKRSQLGRSRDGFYGGDNTVAAPTAGNKVGSATYTDGSINFLIASESAGIGTWKDTDYAFAYSFVYDGNQESALFEVAATLATADVTANRPWEVTVYAANATSAADYDARITGARIYWKYYDAGNSKISEGEWNLLVDCDFTGAANDTNAYGIRGKLSDKFKDWSVSSNDANAKIVIQDPSIDTYATINGYGSNEGRLHLGNSGDGYKAAAFANRRMFLASVKMAFEDGVQRQKLDRIMYSPVNKPDVFPLSNFIDVVQGDAEPYIKLESVGNKLFAFKSDNLYVINIGNANPAGWYLESTHKGMGVMSSGAVFKTDFGLVWANVNGLYVYQTGSGIAELTEDKVLSGYKTDSYSVPSWGKLITAGTIVGYDKKEKEIVVVLDSGSVTANQDFGGNGADVVVYDLETESFFFGKNRLLSAGIASNFNYDWNGDLIYASETGDSVTIKAWQSDDQTSTAFLYQTKDFDFGMPSRYKKIYAIYVTYKHTHATGVTDFLKYVQDGGTSFVTTNLSNNTLDQADGTFEIHKVTFDTPLKCQSVALQLNGGTNATKIEINDIGIEYRLLPAAKVAAT